MKISRKRLNESYKLRFYKKQKGLNQGNLDHEEFFDTKAEAVSRYKEVFDRNAYSLNPTVWVGDGDNWKRLSEVEINESLKEDFEDYEDRLFYRKSDRLENSVEKRFPGWKIFVEGSWQSGIGSDFIYIYPPDDIKLEDGTLSIYLDGSFLDISNREILKLIAQEIKPVIQANESLNEALSDEAKANNEMIQRILNKKPSQLTAKEKKFLADNDLVRYDGTGGQYTPNIRKNGAPWYNSINKGDRLVTNRSSNPKNRSAYNSLNDVDQLNLLKKRDERSRARIEADKDPDILAPQNYQGIQGPSKLQDFNKNYEKDIKGSKRYAKNARDFMDSYTETGSRLKADLAKHSADISRVLKDQAKKSLEHRPKFESLFDKSISLNEGESLSDREDIQNEIHRYDLLAPRYDKQSIIDELMNDGYSYEEAEYIANHTTNLDESLGVSSSAELAARKDVTDYFQKMLYDQLLENPPQAQELDTEIDSYDADWCPQEFDSMSERKFNKVNSLIDQLSIALSDTYFDDSLLESLKEDFVPKYFYRVMKYLYNNDYEGCDEIELEELLMNSPQFHNMSEKTAEAYVEEYLTYYRDPKEFRKLKVDESLTEAAGNQYGRAIPYQVSDDLWRVRLSNKYRDLTEYDIWGYGSTTKPKNFNSEIAAEDAAAKYNQRYEDIEDELDESLKEDDAVDDDNFLTEGFLHIVKE